MDTTYTSGQLLKFTALLEQKGVNHEMFQIGLNTGISADFAEALATGDSLVKLDRNVVRQAFGLGPLFKTDKHGRILITVTGLGLTGAE